MCNKETIASRLRQLREYHNLSVSQASSIFGKNKAAFSQIELGNIKLSHDFLIEIADFFAVSLDWLTGRSEEPYSDSVIKRLENELAALYHDVNLSKNQDLLYFKAAIILYFSKDYFSYSEEYTLEERADVVYALNFLKYAAKLLDEEGYNSQEKPFQTALYEKSKMSDDEKESIIDKLTAIGPGALCAKAI